MAQKPNLSAFGEIYSASAKDKYHAFDSPDAGYQFLNEIIAPLNKELACPGSTPSLPVIFIIGAPRSGTTLLSQLLSSSGLFGYINNFVARFWMAPALGALIYKTVLDPEFHCKSSFQSSLGVTEHLHEPHEFGYFWRRWFHFGNSHQLTDEELAGVDWKALAQELASLESIYNKPLLFKNLACGLQLHGIANHFSNSRFIHIKRDPLYTAQSILLCRKSKQQNEREWFSLLPNSCLPLLDSSPYEQVASQVYYSQHEIEKQALLHSNNYFEVTYENLCSNPQKTLAAVYSFLFDHDFTHLFDQQYFPESFSCHNIVQIHDDQFRLLSKYVGAYFDQ